MKRSVGRPMKHAHFLESLQDDLIYSPATIVAAYLLKVPDGVAQASPSNPTETKTIRIRVRHSLARFAKNHDFPTEGDGPVSHPITGQAPMRGWTGKRWKKAAASHLAALQVARATESSVSDSVFSCSVQSATQTQNLAQVS